MGFTVNIRFHGTVALVLLDNDARACLLLPEYDRQELVGLDPLVPYIRFPLAAYNNGLNRQEAKPAPSGGPFDGYGHIILDHEYLTIKADFGSDSQKLLPDLHDGKSPDNTPINEDFQSLIWLELERFTPTTGDIHPDLVQLPFKRTQSPRLAARVDVLNGTLNTPGASETAVTFITSGTGTSSRKPIARETSATFSVTGTSLVFRSVPIGTLSDSGAYDITFTPPADVTTLPLVIGNEPEEEIYATADEMQIVPTPNQGAKEFDLFYKLSLKQVQDRALPAGQNKGSKGKPMQLCMNVKMRHQP